MLHLICANDGFGLSLQGVDRIGKRCRPTATLTGNRRWILLWALQRRVPTVRCSGQWAAGEGQLLVPGSECQPVSDACLCVNMR